MFDVSRIQVQISDYMYTSYMHTHYINNNDVPLSKIYNDDDSVARNGRVVRRKLTRTFNFLEKAQCDNDNARSAVSQHTRDTRRERFRDGVKNVTPSPSPRNTVFPLVFYSIFLFYSFTPSAAAAAAADVCVTGINHTRVKHM